MYRSCDLRVNTWSSLQEEFGNVKHFFFSYPFLLFFVEVVKRLSADRNGRNGSKFWFKSSTVVQGPVGWRRETRPSNNVFCGEQAPASDSHYHLRNIYIYMHVEELTHVEELMLN